MDRMETFLKYTLWLVGFIILSEFLINVGLNSNYDDLKRKDNNNQINIYQAEATLVNGRIRGIVTNSEANDISNKYLKFEFYSARNVFLGNKYVQIQELPNGESQNFEIFFKLEDVEYYQVSIVDEKDNSEEIELIPEEYTRPEIILLTVVTLLIFW